MLGSAGLTVWLPEAPSRILTLVARRAEIALAHTLVFLRSGPTIRAMPKMKAWKLPGSDGTTVTSASLKGRPYVLYFYPKDMTPGCTTEACDFRDNMAKLKRAGVAVYGVSPDPIARHEKFIAKHDLNFVLLSAEDHAIADKLGVWGPKKFMGREFDGIIRTTFLVDAAGNVAKEWRSVKVKGHADDVLAAAKELKKG